MKKLSIITFVVLLGFMTKANAAIFGQLVNGAPVVTVPFNDLQQTLQTAAVSNGFVSATLVSMQIVYENNNPVFKYKYFTTNTIGEISNFQTGIPLVIVNNDFQEHLVKGGKQITTCKAINCSGCQLNDNDCVPPCVEASTQEKPVSCEKTTTNGGGGGGSGGGIAPWIGLITIGVNWLLGRI